MATVNGSGPRPRWIPASRRISRHARSALIATLMPLVSACGTLPTVVPLRTAPTAAEMPRPVAKVDPSLLAACPDLPQAADGRLATLQRNHQQVAGLYYDCQARQAALARSVQLREQQETRRLTEPAAKPN